LSYASNLKILVLFVAAIAAVYVGTALTSSPADAEAPTRARAVQLAKSYLGTPYEYGGTTRDGMDCSGLVYRVYHYKLGLDIPRTARDQWRWTGDVKRLSLSGTKPGDLVFSDFNNDGTVDHVGIAAVRNGRLLQINATVPGEDVRYSPIYRDAYVGTKRWLRN
jgi:cell wall-associated NlpC family hydrolase